MSREIPDDALPSRSGLCFWLVEHLLHLIRSTTQIWVVMCQQYGISSLVLRRHFVGKPVVASWNVTCFLRLGNLIMVSRFWVNNAQKICTGSFFSADRPNDGWHDYYQLKLNTNQESGLKRHFKAALLWARGIFVLGCRTVGSSLVPPDKLQT